MSICARRASWLPFFVLLLAAPALAPAARAERATTGELEVVLAATAGGATGTAVRVRIDGSGLVTSRRLVVAAAGRTLVAGLPPGRYRVVVEEGPAYRPAEALVRAGERSRISLQPVEIAAEVTVAGPVGPLAGSEMGTDLRLERLQELPVARDYHAWTQLAPGVTVVPNGTGTDLPVEPASKGGANEHDRGGRLGSQDNSYLLDGIDVTGPASGSGDLAFFDGLILEEKVVTSGVPAEMAGGAGMVVDIVTRSGGPSFHGAAELYRLAPSLTASSKTADPRLRLTPEDRTDFGATLGGPVVAERLWFFEAGQERRRHGSVELSPSASPTGGRESYEQIWRNFFGKATWAPTAAQQVALSYYEEPRQAIGTLDPNTPRNRYARGEEDLALANLSWQGSLGDRTLVEARAARLETDGYSRPEHPEAGPSNTLLFPPGESVPAWMRALGSSGDGGRTQRKKVQVSTQWSHSLELGGEHRLAAGAQYLRWEEATGPYTSFGYSLTSLAPETRRRHLRRGDCARPAARERARRDPLRSGSGPRVGSPSRPPTPTATAW